MNKNYKIMEHIFKLNDPAQSITQERLWALHDKLMVATDGPSIVVASGIRKSVFQEWAVYIKQVYMGPPAWRLVSFMSMVLMLGFMVGHNSDLSMMKNVYQQREVVQSSYYEVLPSSWGGWGRKGE